jgi:hypothetical protein
VKGSAVPGFSQGYISYLTSIEELERSARLIVTPRRIIFETELSFEGMTAIQPIDLRNRTTQQSEENFQLGKLYEEVLDRIDYLSLVA